MEKVIPSDEYETLLKQLVQIQSPYFHEDDVMAFVCDWFEKKGVPAEIRTFAEPKETDFHGKNDRRDHGQRQNPGLSVLSWRPS